MWLQQRRAARERRLMDSTKWYCSSDSDDYEPGPDRATFRKRRDDKAKAKLQANVKVDFDACKHGVGRKSGVVCLVCGSQESSSEEVAADAP